MILPNKANPSTEDSSPTSCWVESQCRYRCMCMCVLMSAGGSILENLHFFKSKCRHHTSCSPYSTSLLLNFLHVETIYDFIVCVLLMFYPEVSGSFITDPTFNSITDLHASLDSNTIKHSTSDKMSFGCVWGRKVVLLLFLRLTTIHHQFSPALTNPTNTHTLRQIHTCTYTYTHSPVQLSEHLFSLGKSAPWAL